MSVTGFSDFNVYLISKGGATLTIATKTSIDKCLAIMFMFLSV